MPPRILLNAVYAMLIDGLDEKQRDEFDASLYGWNEKNQQADRKIFDMRGGGDE